MEVERVKLYQRKLIFDDLSAMFYNGRGRERVGLAGGRAFFCFVLLLLFLFVFLGGGGGGGKGQRQTQRELHSKFVVFQLFCR